MSDESYYQGLAVLDRIEAARTARGLRITQFSRLIFGQPRRWSIQINQFVVPKVRRLVKMAAVLGVSPEYLLTGHQGDAATTATDISLAPLLRLAAERRHEKVMPKSLCVTLHKLRTGRQNDLTVKSLFDFAAFWHVSPVALIVERENRR